MYEASAVLHPHAMAVSRPGASPQRPYRRVRHSTLSSSPRSYRPRCRWHSWYTPSRESERAKRAKPNSTSSILAPVPETHLTRSRT